MMNTLALFQCVQSTIRHLVLDGRFGNRNAL